MTSIDTDPAYRALLALSARIGADRLLVQAAGGNSSIKTADGVMWIKASGTWLADAEQRAIMVPVDYARMEAALVRGDPAAARQQDFVVAALAAEICAPRSKPPCMPSFPFASWFMCIASPRSLMPSAPMRKRRSRLCSKDFDWRFIPYAKPGVALAEAIRAAPPAPVYVLANHGLVVASETVDEAASLLADIAARLEAPRRQGFVPDLARLAELTAGTNYVPAMENSLHALADPALRPIATRSLYPDHVIFLGRGVPLVQPGETLPEARALVLVKGVGAMLARNISPSARAMALCLADVLSLLPDGVQVTTLSEADEDALLDWDAERYRQEIARA